MAFWGNNVDDKEVFYQQSMKKITKFLKKNFYLILCMIGVIGVIFCNALAWNGSYGDGDGYMRLIRIKQWLSNPTYWEQKIFVSNYPFGEVLHWTRPVDLLWILMSYPFLLAVGLDDALFLGGAFLSPVLGVLGVIGLGYGLRRIFNVWLAMLGGFFFLNHHIVQAEFSFFKADHHSFMIVLLVFAFSELLCWIGKRKNRYLWGSAFAIALSSLVMIDGIIFAVLFTGYFVYQYIFKGMSIAFAYRFVRNYVIFIIIAWVSNPCFEGLFYIDNSRLSILFIIAFGLLGVGFKILELVKLHTFKLKLVSVLCIGGIVSVCLLSWYGKKVFSMPVSSEVFDIWASMISETKPIWKMSGARMFSIYFTLLSALLLGVFLIYKGVNKRILWVNCFIGGWIFLLSILSVRFSRYFPIFEIVPYLCLIEKVYKNSSFYMNKEGDFPAKVYLIILFVLSISPISLVPQSFLTEADKINYYHPIVVAKIREIGGTLVADTFLTPRYVYDAGVNTVSTPYHRNVEGIVDGVSILFSEDDEKLLDLLLKHKVSQVLVFEENEDKFYDMSAENSNKLYWRLIKRQNIPYCLEEIETGVSYARLFRVRIKVD